MAVGELPNDGYTLRSLVADLERIRKSNNFWTDVDVVDLPDYDPKDEGEWLKVDQASVHVWIDSDLQVSERENSGDYRPTLRVLVLGVLKVDQGLQIALIGLKTDVRRVLLENASRDFPGLSVPNTWGIYTRQAPGFEIDYRYHPDRTGSFLSMWDIDYQSPFAKG
jgi:hypothetical protein